MPLTVAIGPKSSQPSWQWVGEDTATELTKYFKVEKYESHQTPTADVVISVKIPPSRQVIEAKRHSSFKLIYLPIDRFYSRRHIIGIRNKLQQCDRIIIHSRSLSSLFKPFAPVSYIDHHSKYALPTLAAYKSCGYVLWIGALEHLPLLLHYLQRRPLTCELRLLSNLDNARSLNKAMRISSRLGVPFEMTGGQINGYKVEQWSAAAQADAMTNAKGAIDIKGSGFNQRHKPPTKAQKYICSGIPLAMNRCPTTEYLERLGLTVPKPIDAYWLTREYYDETCSVAQRLRPELSLETIGRRFKKYIDLTLNISP
jgi:hypothetical protein